MSCKIHKSINIKCQDLVCLYFRKVASECVNGFDLLSTLIVAVIVAAVVAVTRYPSTNPLAPPYPKRD